MHARYRARRAAVSIVLLAAGFVVLWRGGDTAAEEAKPSAAIEIAAIQRAEPVDLAKDILPIFRANCTACHNATDHEAELSLETAAAIHKGGESRPAVVA